MRVIKMLTTSTFILLVACTSSFSLVSAQTPVPTVDPSYLNFVKPKIGKFGSLLGGLEPQETAGFAISALKTSPANSLEELAKGVIIGSVYFISPDPSSKVQPGVYAVRVIKDKEAWVAQFLDSNGQIVGRATARVVKTSRVSTPTVSLEESKCWRFDSVKVCI